MDLTLGLSIWRQWPHFLPPLGKASGKRWGSNWWRKRLHVAAVGVPGLAYEQGTVGETWPGEGPESGSQILQPGTHGGVIQREVPAHLSLLMAREIGPYTGQNQGTFAENSNHRSHTFNQH